MSIKGLTNLKSYKHERCIQDKDKDNKTQGNKITQHTLNDSYTGSCYYLKMIYVSYFLSGH